MAPGSRANSGSDVWAPDQFSFIRSDPLHPSTEASSLGWWQGGGSSSRRHIQLQQHPKKRIPTTPVTFFLAGGGGMRTLSWKFLAKFLLMAHWPGWDDVLTPKRSLQRKWGCPNWLRLTKTTPELEMESLSLEFLGVLSEEHWARREMVAGLAPNHVHHPELQWCCETRGGSPSGLDGRWGAWDQQQTFRELGESDVYLRGRINRAFWWVG